MALFFAVAEIVHSALYLYLISFVLLPVSVIVFWSDATTVPDTVGDEFVGTNTVNVAVVADPTTAELYVLEYVLHVIVHVPLFA